MGEEKSLDENISYLIEEQEKRMMAQMDDMINSNSQNVRMRCLEAALRYYEFKEYKDGSMKNLMNIAKDFYKFVKGE